MGGHYTYLKERKSVIAKQCEEEEKRFFETIENGMQMFHKEIERIVPQNLLWLESEFGKDFAKKCLTLNRSYIEKVGVVGIDMLFQCAKGQIEIEAIKKEIEKKCPNECFDNDAKAPVFDGKVAFTLYDTYGFPLDLTQDMLREWGISLDLNAFEAYMSEQKLRSKAHWKGSGDSVKDGDFNALLSEYGENKFVGYECVSVESKILALLDSNFKRVESFQAGQEGWVMLESTPFYPESGGPVGDKGILKNDSNIVAQVLDTQKYFGLNLSKVVATSMLKVGDLVKAQVDSSRFEIIKHHSATHLLHYALRQILGPHIAQAGSLVEANRLRFDFSHPKALSVNELEQIEALVNE